MRLKTSRLLLTNNTRKMAAVVAEETGAEPLTIETPITEPVDVLCLGSAVYAAVVDWRVKKFIKTLTPELVKNVIDRARSLMPVLCCRIRCSHRR